MKPTAVYGSYTLVLYCDGLLKSDPTCPGMFTLKSVDEVAQDLCLVSLLQVPTLDTVKIKCLHTCGSMQLRVESCLNCLDDIGRWFVQQYQARGQSAQYTRHIKTTGEDWAEPDAVLKINLMDSGNVLC